MKKELLLLGSLLILTQNILAGNIGIGYGVTTPIYHNNKNTYILPIVDFEYNKFLHCNGRIRKSDTNLKESYAPVSAVASFK